MNANILHAAVETKQSRSRTRACRPAADIVEDSDGQVDARRGGKKKKKKKKKKKMGILSRGRGGGWGVRNAQLPLHFQMRVQLAKC